MPEYDFEGPNGEHLIRYYAMGEAPSIGQTVEIDGVPCMRVLSPLQMRVTADRRFVSHSLPRNHPDAPNLDEKGRPYFTSKREVKEFCAKTQDGPGGGFDYD